MPESESDYDEDTSSTTASRKPQINSYEKNLLMQIVGRPEIKKIVENKQTNGVWRSKKEECWENVSKEFCSDLSVTYRTGDQLKKAWDNIKARTKKKLAAVKRSCKKTGGGKGVRDMSPMTERVMAIVPAQMVSMENAFDDDADVYSATREGKNDVNSAACEGKDDLDHDIGGIELTRKDVPRISKASNSVKPSKSTEPKPTSELKRKLVAGQEIVIRMEEELHEKKMKLVDLQIQYEETRIRFLQEEHAMKMKAFK